MCLQEFLENRNRSRELIEIRIPPIGDTPFVIVIRNLALDIHVRVLRACAR